MREEREAAFYIGAVPVYVLTPDRETIDAAEVLAGARFDQPYWGDERFSLLLKNGLIFVQYMDGDDNLILASAIPTYGVYKTMLRRFFENPRVSLMTSLKTMIWLGKEVDTILPFEASLASETPWIIFIDETTGTRHWIRVSSSYERNIYMPCVRFQKKERGTMAFKMTESAPTTTSVDVWDISSEMQVDYRKQDTAIQIPGYDYRVDQAILN